MTKSLPIKKNKNSIYLRELPDGCKLCKEGSKLVLVITGICPRKCFYCPLSDAKKDKDLVWANEWLTNDEKDILTEGKLINAKGAGITGGDPLARLDRTIQFIKLFKKKFGKNFHIHLYTSLDLVTPETLRKLKKSGLDEIRFHPDIEDKKIWDRIKIAKKISKNWDVGMEIPVIPKFYKETMELIQFSEKHIDFLNLNELEISDNNANSLTEKGYDIVDGSYAIVGSKRMAKKIITELAKNNTKLKVNFCSTSVKDGEQLTNRIKRRAQSVKKEYDYVTKEGMLVRGAIYPIILPEFSYRNKIKALDKKDKLSELKKILEDIKKNNNIEKELIEIDEQKLRILIAPWILEELIQNKKIKYKSAIVTEYPTFDQMEIDLEYLN